jgi:actin-related protein 6
MICRGKGNTYVADQIENECNDYSGLTYKRPFDRGYLIDCELESVIWEHIFNNRLNSLDISSTTLIQSRQPFTPTTIQQDTESLVFEYFGFPNYSSLSTAYLNFYNAYHSDPNSRFATTGSALIVDSGFSFTHILPVVNFKIQPKAIKRIDMGGKALTNYLKEVVSLRYYNMMDETYLINIIKERMCKVSLDFVRELEDTQESHRLLQSYILPDYQTSMTGRVRSKKETESQKDEQILTLNNERVAVPELLFNPSDIGIEQSGVPEAIYNSVSAVPDECAQSILYDSILLVGGNTRFKNYDKRIQNDLRKFVPSMCNISVHTAQE